MISKELIQKIIQATNIKASEIVLLHFWGEDSDREILHEFSTEVVKLGAAPLELQQSRTVNELLFQDARETCYPSRYFNIFKNIDVVVDICMYTPVRLGNDLKGEQLKQYKKYMSNLFQVLTKKSKFIQIRIPSRAYAKEEGIPDEIFIDQMIKAYDIDYIKLKKECEEQQRRLKGSKEIVIHTDNDSELHLFIENRDWYIDAGEGDFPSGEIYIAPNEELSYGTIYFKRLWLDMDEVLTDITLKIEKGRIVDSNSLKVLEFLKDLPPNGDVIAEFGIGMNPNIDELTGYSVLDEKKEGTFHIAIGMNTLFGGKNECIMHMDIVGFGEIEYL